jgi:hypothetical protein
MKQDANDPEFLVFGVMQGESLQRYKCSVIVSAEGAEML